MDADYKTLCVNLGEIKKKRTKDTTAVCMVHIGGLMSSELPAIADYCRDNGLYLVEDAAHAHGSEVGRKRAGKYGIAAAYSFFSTKVITSTEGGVVVTDDDGLADFTRSYRDYGKRSQWESVHTNIGMNCRMSEICAVIGLAQAKRLDEFIAWRERIAEKYSSSLKGYLELILPEGRSSWYKFILYIPKGIDRNAVKSKLKERGIFLPGGVYDVPAHLQPVFKHLKLEGKFPIAEEACLRHMCLPIFYQMTEEEADYVISNVIDLIRS
jgi:dTDP-4-amino-4,6-dideoxygalactose transaminase